MPSAMSKHDSAHYVKAMRRASGDLGKAVEQIASVQGRLQEAVYSWEDSDKVSRSEAALTSAYLGALFTLADIVAMLDDVAGVEGQVPEFGRIQHRMTTAQVKKIHSTLADAADAIFSVHHHILGMRG